jgi:hypothetical protein
MERLVGMIAAASAGASPDDTCEIIRPRLVVRQSTGGEPSGGSPVAPNVASSIAPD